MLQSMFRAIDADKNGVLSLDEVCYGYANWLFCSGPDSPFSLLAGPLLQEE